MFEEYQSENFNPDERYSLAYKRVKKIKGFYVHALVYVLVNLFIIASSYNISLFDSGVFLRWETFSTAFFWGIGLLAHGFSVFGRDVLFGHDWEEKKIQLLMDKDKAPHPPKGESENWI